MCGIAGIISLRPPVNDKDVKEAKEMLAMLRHRGPDSCDIFYDKKCVLGNTKVKDH